MDIDTLLLEAEEKMEGAINSFKYVLSNARTGRANPKMFDSLTVEYYGVETKVNQIANISVPEGTQIYIKPYDKSTVGLIEKAIFAGNYGVTPQNDGVGVRIILPPMTQENRMAVCKDLKNASEQVKVQIRNIRQDLNNGIKQAEKDKEISEDERDAYLKDAQDLTDKYTKVVDEELDLKVKDVMTI